MESGIPSSASKRLKLREKLLGPPRVGFLFPLGAPGAIVVRLGW
jgi:hypothetical protein